MNAHIPGGNHILVHLLQLGLGGLKSVGGRIKLISLEGLIGELDMERLLVLL